MWANPLILEGDLFILVQNIHIFTVQICTFLLGLDLLFEFCSDILEYCQIMWNTINYIFCPPSTSDM